MTRLIKSLSLLAMMFTVVVICSNSQAALVTIDFNDAAEGDYSTYSEDGFTLTPNIGDVLISDTFSPGNNAAQPTAGFGQGADSSFTFTNDSNLVFSALSIDLLEATVFPDTFGVTIIGTKSDFTSVTQTFTLDGISGREVFTFSSDFADLVSLKIAEDAFNSFFLDIVAIDNVLLEPIPEPATFLLLGLGGLALLRKRKG